MESETIAYSQSAAPISHLIEQKASTDPHSSALIRATQETEAPIPLSTHFGSQKEVVSTIHELQAQTSQSAREVSETPRQGSSLPEATYAGSQTVIHELEAVLSTKESDKLAVERVEALKRKEQ
jgi:hypothetical protein